MVSFKRLFASIMIVPFMATMMPCAMAAEVAPWMPQAGTMVSLSAKFEPALMVGIQLDAKDPFRFNFLFERGQKELTMDAKRSEYRKLVKYFLASLTTPNQDMWVNLSPYEHERIIPDNFGLTEMGRDLLAQDYLLKQITSSLIHPEEGAAKAFWKKVYEKAFEKYGTTDIPLDTFNKVWIMPDTATVFHRYDTALIVENHLKVMMEQDYLALEKNQGLKSEVTQGQPSSETAQLAAEVVREIVIPMLEKEVNEGEHFTPLRQVYSAMLMATWFKKSLMESVLGQVYADKSKVAGVELNDPAEKEQIYQKYLQAYKVGVFNFIKEDVDSFTQEVIPRKYFSGGTITYNSKDVHEVDSAEKLTPAQMDNAGKVLENGVDKASVNLVATSIVPDASQTPLDDPKSIYHGIAPLQFWRIKSILDKGILSVDERKRVGVTTERNSGVLNGNDRISFSRSPIMFGGYVNGSSFEQYSMSGVSFIVQTSKPIMSALSVSRFIDEVQVEGSVAIDEIVGISVPESQRKAEIATLSFGFENMNVASVEAFALEVARNIKSETDEDVDIVRVTEIVQELKRNHTVILHEDSIEVRQLNQLLAVVLAKGLKTKYGIVTFEQYLEHYIGLKKMVYYLEKNRVWKQDFRSQLTAIGRPMPLGLDLSVVRVIPKNNHDSSQKNSKWQQGGIDLDAGLLNMKIKRDGEGMPLPLPQQDPALMRIEGLSPTILEIMPANAMPIFSDLQNGRVNQVT